jgi:hypothetical protein
MSTPAVFGYGIVWIVLEEIVGFRVWPVIDPRVKLADARDSCIE